MPITFHHICTFHITLTINTLPSQKTFINLKTCEHIFINKKYVLYSYVTQYSALLANNKNFPF